MAEFIDYQPNNYFKSTIWTGDDASPRTFTNVEFQPDFTWLKSMTSSQYNYLYDSVRGAGLSKEICSNLAGQEGDAGGTTGYVSAFAANGFTVTAGSSNSNVTNANGEDYASWNWRAGTTSGLSGGTITPSSYSISSTAKFGIYQYDGNGTGGATIAHGLVTAPNCVMCKRLDASQSWQVGHSWTLEGTDDWDRGWNLNTNAASADDVAYWNDTAPDTTNITLGTHAGCNNNGSSYIMYAWCSRPGAQHFGMFMGNGSTSGPMVYTGFRPSMVIIKRLSTGSWTQYDVNRKGYNEDNCYVQPDNHYTENCNKDIDLYSNGFRPVTTNEDINSNGSNYIFLAWADSPIVSSNDVPGVARQVTTMLLGFAAFAERPFSTVADDGSVTITVTANSLSISIGNPGITADSIVEILTPNPLTLGIGSVTITGDANLSLTGNPVTLGIGNVTISADANMYPTGNSVVITSGTVTITGTADVSPTGASLALSSGDVAAITWSEIIPGVTMTWTPIDPT